MPIRDWGDAQTSVYPLSAVKPMHALPQLGRCGSVLVDDSKLAMTYASHDGESEHLRVAERMITHVGASSGSCAERIGRLMRRQRKHWRWQEGFQAANACSGNHAGLVGAATALGIDRRGYGDPARPLQRRQSGGAALRCLRGEAAVPSRAQAVSVRRCLSISASVLLIETGAEELASFGKLWLANGRGGAWSRSRWQHF
jgi:L-asparaginase II